MKTVLLLGIRLYLKLFSSNEGLASGKIFVLYEGLASGVCVCVCVCEPGHAEAESRFYPTRSEKVGKLLNPF